MIDITTPAIIFPAISMLMLGYTNRFMVITQRLRSLHEKYQENTAEAVLKQICNLRLRVKLIRWMQFLGVLSFIFCSASILMILRGFGYPILAFEAGMLFLLGSLLVALWEIAISTTAIEIELKTLEHKLE